MMTLQPISRSSEFEAVATRNFLKSTGELFCLSSQNCVNFRGEKQRPHTVFLLHLEIEIASLFQCRYIVQVANYFC